MSFFDRLFRRDQPDGRAPSYRDVVEGVASVGSGNAMTDEGARAAGDPVSSIQPRFRQSTVDDAFSFMTSVARKADDLPDYGDPQRDVELRKIWKTEPILSGAVSSMVQKMVSVGWTLTGGRNRAARFAGVLHNAEGGAGWGAFIAKLVQDYLTLDRGAFFELGRLSATGPVDDVYNLDALHCTLTGNIESPVLYQAALDGKTRKLSSDYAVHLASLPSPSEGLKGLGFSAVSRAIKSAKLLLALYTYDSEKLSHMPPEGLVAITGLTFKQVQDAMKMYKDERDKRGQYVFPGILWLASALGTVDVKMIPFSTLPESFDREVVVTLYVYTLALAFGVDAREFWPATVTGATKADALIQAQKAKGKGPGEVMSSIERSINFHVLPDGVSFAFDFSDDEEDRLKAEIDGMRITNAGTLVDKTILSPEEARQLLVTQRVLPDVFATPAVFTSNDVEGHKVLDLVRYRHVRGQLEGPFSLLGSTRGIERVSPSSSGNGHLQEDLRVSA